MCAVHRTVFICPFGLFVFQFNIIEIAFESHVIVVLVRLRWTWDFSVSRTCHGYTVRLFWFRLFFSPAVVVDCPETVVRICVNMYTTVQRAHHLPRAKIVFRFCLSVFATLESTQPTVSFIISHAVGSMGPVFCQPNRQNAFQQTKRPTNRK